MANPERPKSRLPDGRLNPAYTAWRKANILDKPKSGPTESQLDAAFIALKSLPERQNKATDVAMVKSAESAVQTETLTLRCIKQAVNKRYVYCDLKGIRVPVKIKKGIGHRLVKKTIKVSVDRSGEQPVYTHVPR